MSRSVKPHSTETPDLFTSLGEGPAAPVPEALATHPRKAKRKAKGKPQESRKDDGRCSSCEDRTQAFLKDADVAKRFAVSRQTIWKWVKRGWFPEPVQISTGTTRWRFSDVLTFERKLQRVRVGSRRARKPGGEK